MRPLMVRISLLLAISLLVTFLPTGALLAEAPSEDYLGGFVRDFERVSKKLADLAEVTPAGKYDWSPTDEVRSVSRVLMHVAGANFFLTKSLGVEMPEGMPEDLEAVTEKDAALEWLKKSFDHVRQAAEAVAEGDLGQKVEVFGREREKRDVFFIISGHNHEHLGQMIAYARSVGVVPPWSAARSEG